MQPPLLARLPQIVRDAAPVRLFIVYCVLHAIFAILGYAVAVPGNVFTTFWPAAGLLLAACVICRRRQRWALLAASVVAELAVGWLRVANGFGGIGPGLVLYQAFVQAIVYGLSAMMVERWWRVPLPAGLSKLVRGTGVIALMLIAGMAAAAAWPAWFLRIPYPTVLVAWLSSQLLGTIAVTPVFIAWWMAIRGEAGEVVGSRIELLILVLAALVATLAVFGAWPATARYQPVYVHFPLLLWAAMRFPPRYVSLLGLAIATLTAALTGIGRGPFAPDGDGFATTYLPLQLFMSSVILSALFLSVANYERHRSERSLRGYARALADAEDRARRRTAIDLHDGIGQELFGMSLNLAAARREVTDPRVQQTLDETQVILDGIVKNTRRLIEELDPPWIHEIGLPLAINWLATRFRERASMQIEVRVQGEPPAFTTEERALLFRSTRELLQNIVRHASVDRATVDLRTGQDALEVVVCDAGSGFDNRFEVPGNLHGGFGLFSVREQLATHGAHLRVETAPGAGCTATIIWPLRRSVREAVAVQGATRPA